MFDFQIYSPTQEISDPYLKEKKVRLFIKRDDMIHPFISGNKWRKLKYNLIKAKEEHKNHLITFGGAWSNHVLATACASAKYGFKSTAFIRGEEIETDILFACRLFGMNLKFTDRYSYRDKKSLFNTFFSDDSTAFFIDEGGSGEEATKGCSELVAEFEDIYDHIFCAAGTGTTAAGILNGISSSGLRSNLHVIPVLKGADFLTEEIHKLSSHQHSFSFHPDYHFGGYAKTTPELLQFIQNFSSSTGILLDPVYTGKMMYAIFDLIEKGSFYPGSKILAIHTGGLFGLLGMKNRFHFTSSDSPHA